MLPLEFYSMFRVYTNGCSLILPTLDVDILAVEKGALFSGRPKYYFSIHDRILLVLSLSRSIFPLLGL